MDSKLFDSKMQQMPDIKGGPHDFSYDADIVSVSPGQTPSQTVGPYFAYGLTPETYGYDFPDLAGNRLYPQRPLSELIQISGRVIQGEEEAVHDALVEIYQADPNGKYVDQPTQEGFTGYGRCGTGFEGKASAKEFSFFTLKPGGVEEMPPLIDVIITARGLLNHLFTRLYFSDEDNTADPVLAEVPENRRHTLVAIKQSEGYYRFDIHLQGENETVFFDL